MKESLPSFYRCLEYNPEKQSLSLSKRAMPHLRPNEVLIRVWGSPINPSDRLFCQGLYGMRAEKVVVPGFEGSGVVVNTGSNFMARRMAGKRVAGAVQGQDGFWAEYVVVPFNQCMPLGKEITDEVASCAFVNPLSAWALFEPLRKKEFPSFVQTAAASQLGRMILRLSKKYQVTGVHIVHRPELVELLRKEGAEIVLDSSQVGFEEQLRGHCENLKISYAIDAVAGESTGNLAAALPEGGKIIVYGVLSGKKCEVNPGDLIFKNIQVQGFWLSHYLKRQNVLNTVKLFSRLKDLLKNEGMTQVARELTLEEALADLTNQPKPASFGKVLIKP